MSQALMQYSFHAGELAPALNARVDISKYKSGAATMLNFYPDYRGGASSRPGTKYCLRCKSSVSTPRIIPFQSSATSGGTNYAIELGPNYMRFYSQGNPLKESFVTISAMSKANPCTITTSGSHGYNVGDWVFMNFSGAGASHQLAARYFIVASVPSSTTFTINDLYGTAVDSTNYNTLTGTQHAQRIYTLVTPYKAQDLATLKYAQNANTLLITHQNYAPMLLQLLSLNPVQWILSPAVFGTTISPPTVGAPSSTLAAGSVNYAYAITSVDSGGQESTLSTIVQLNSLQDIRTVAGTNVINWTAQPGAVTYNVYRAEPSYAGVVPTGAAFGFIGNANGTSFVDSNIAPDFSQSPPTAQNPFQGQSVTSYSLTASGSYTSAPSIQIGAPSPGGQQATAEALLTLLSTTVTNGGSGYSVGQQIVLIGQGDTTKTPVAICRVATLSGSAVATITILNYPSLGPGTTAPTDLVDINGGTLHFTVAAWGVGQIIPLSIGSGYLSTPSITFSPAGATATLNLSGIPSTANPGVCTYFQQRLVLAAPASNPQEFNMSQTGVYFNFNISNPVTASDAIQGSLVSFQINTIKSLTPMSTGLLVMSDRAVWLINGGSIGSPVSPSQIVATQHSYIGASDVPPIVINYDVLYVQAKNSIVRDLTYNFYAQIYTGTDISILSSHLFYGYQISAWAYAEEPFKLIWCVRGDGTLLSLTYLKEQEIIGWSRHNTQGSFVSVCSIIESAPILLNTYSENQAANGTLISTNVDATYFIVQRTVNGQTFFAVERLMERQFISPTQFSTPLSALAWCVDYGSQYGGGTGFNTPVTTVGPLVGVSLDHLQGASIVGLADGTPFTAVVSGNPASFTLASPATTITFGLSYTPQLQTLQLDTGEPTSQGKRKKIPAVTVRVQDTLGLSIGKTFSSLVPMKDLVKGNLNVPSNTVVNDLFTGDARTILDPTWDVPGQYCIQQSNPWPATILGVIPEIVVGDTPPK